MKHLIVLGTQRSGKTLVSRALNMHPNIIVQVEPYFHFFKSCRNIFFRDVLRKTNFDPNYPMDSGFCKPYKEKHLLQESFADISFNDSDIVELRRMTIQQQESVKGERAPKIIPLLNRLEAGTAPFVFKQLMDILHEAYFKEGVQLVGLSEGWCDEYIQSLLNLEDVDVKCVHCLRDPRSIVASRNVGGRIHVGKYPLLFIIRHWRKSIAYSLLYEEHPKYMAVQYENLVLKPELWFQEICAFLEVPFSQKLLDPSTFVNGDGSLWKQNSAFNVSDRGGFSQSSIDRWKDVLSKEEIGVVEYLCKAEMEYLNLKRFNPEYPLKDLLCFREKEDEIIDWLKKYNWTFNEKELMLEIVRTFIIENSQISNTEDLIDYFAIDKRVIGKLGIEHRNHQ